MSDQSIGTTSVMWASGTVSKIGDERTSNEIAEHNWQDESSWKIKSEDNVCTSHSAAAKPRQRKENKNNQKQARDCRRRGRAALRKDTQRNGQPSIVPSKPTNLNTTGHIFGDTYVSDEGMLVQGDVCHTVKSKTVVYALREKRSSLDVLVASLVGGAVGDTIGSYAIANRYQTCTKQEDAQEKDDVGATYKSCRPATNGGPQGDVACVSIEPDRIAPIIAAYDHSYLGTDIVRQVNRMTREPMLEHQICSMEIKTTESTPLRLSVLMLKVSKFGGMRYNYLTQQMENHSTVTIIDNFEEALTILRSPRHGLGAVVVYDVNILAAMTGTSRLAHQLVECLAEFTHGGGTTVFEPECDTSEERPSTIDILEEIWYLRLQPWTRSRCAQFWVSPRHTVRVAEALPHYYRHVAEQLFAVNSSAVQRSSKPYGFWGPRYRSASERFLLYIEHGKGSVGALGKLGGKYDTSRMVMKMLGLSEKGRSNRDISTCKLAGLR